MAPKMALARRWALELRPAPPQYPPERHRCSLRHRPSQLLAQAANRLFIIFECINTHISNMTIQKLNMQKPILDILWDSITPSLYIYIYIYSLYVYIHIYTHICMYIFYVDNQCPPN
jgi:hypothetical protein